MPAFEKFARGPWQEIVQGRASGGVQYPLGALGYETACDAVRSRMTRLSCCRRRPSGDETAREQAWDLSTADFRRIPERALCPFADHVRLGQGPSAPLAAIQIMPMVMAPHEIMTNAAKYGALSAPRRVVRLSWKQADRPEGKVLEVHWLEHGGPSVAPAGAAVSARARCSST